MQLLESTAAWQPVSASTERPLMQVSQDVRVVPEALQEEAA